MNTPDVPSLGAVQDPAPRPEQPPFWTPWTTVGWGLLIAAVFVAVQTVVLVAWNPALASGQHVRGPEAGPPAVIMNGDVLAAATLASAVVCSALVLGLTALRRGARLHDALALARPTLPALTGWLATVAGLIAVSDLLTWLLGKPIVPEFMTDMIETADLAPMLWLAIIVAAPFFEELFVRGFLLEGLRRGALGDASAVVLTALFWASIHVQYGFYEIATIFVFGIVLGVARLRSGSLWVPVAMHVLANLVATVEATIVR